MDRREGLARQVLGRDQLGKEPLLHAIWVLLVTYRPLPYLCEAVAERGDPGEQEAAGLRVGRVCDVPEFLQRPIDRGLALRHEEPELARVYGDCVVHPANTAHEVTFPVVTVVSFCVGSDGVEHGVEGFNPVSAISPHPAFVEFCLQCLVSNAVAF